MPVVADGILGRNSMFYQVDPEFITVEEGFNPRLQFDETEHESLKAFVKENGVPGALLCRKGAGDRILLVDGERRLRAVRALNEGGCEIRAVTVEFEKAHISDADRLLQALSRNEGVRLTPFEEANAFRRLIAWGWTGADIARRKGISGALVSNRLALLEATPAVREAHANGAITTAEAVQVVREGRKPGASQDALTKKIAGARAAEKAHDPAEREEKQKVQLRKLTETLGIEEVLLNLIDYARDTGLSPRKLSALEHVLTLIESGKL